MGRGKKKDKTEKPKEELPAVGGLTISGDGASTSSAATAVAPAPTEPPPAEPARPHPEKEEEVFEGLTGGGTRKKHPRKKKTKAETDELKPAPGPVAKQPQSAPVHHIPGLAQPTPTRGQPATSMHEAFQMGRQTSDPVPQTQLQQGPGYQARGHDPRAQAPPRQVTPAFGKAQPPFRQAQPPFGQAQPPFGQAQPPFIQTQPPFGQAREPFKQASVRQPQMQMGQPQAQMPVPCARAPGGEPKPRGPTPVSSGPPSVTSTPSGPSASGLHTPGFYEQRRAVEKEAVLKCRFKIPDRIIGKSVAFKDMKVLCNYLPMTIKPIKVYRYDVGVKPDKPKKMVPVAFNAFLKRKFPNQLVAYDQFKNFYCTKRLQGVTDTDRLEDNVTVNDPNGKAMNFEVSIKLTGEIDLSVLLTYMKNGTSLNPPTEAIQCMDVILRQGSLDRYIKAGRTYFRRPEQPIRLGDGLEMWTGLFQSAIFTSRPWINIDVAHKGFPIQQPLTKLVEEFRLNIREPLTNQRGFEHLHNMLRGLKIWAFLGGDRSVRREMICNGVAEPADRQTFEMTDPQDRKLRITVAQYFMQVKNIRLQMPYMNCLWLGPKDKEIYYPLELCEVAPNQVLNKQLNERQLATIVKEAATPPHIRKRKIEEVVKSMDYSRNPYLTEFGLSVSNQFAEVKAKLIDPPTIKYSDKPARPNNGVWWSSRMLSGAIIQRWAVIALERDVRQVNGEVLIKMLLDQSRQMGINMAPPVQTLYSVRIRDLEKTLQLAKTKNTQLCVVIVPNERGRSTAYSDIKKAAECTVGMLTQCIREQTLQRFSPQTAKNILFKINAKMAGINHSLDVKSIPNCLKKGRVMVVGADVTHPSPDQQNIPSIAAVTASVDNACTVYVLGMSIQTPKMEIIVELEDMMVDHLQEYRKRLGALPLKIYMFRDGVSEGQFALILNAELVAVYNAYRRLSGSEQKPEVMFLLVQKRHHTRLFMPNDSANVSAGTCVDTDIVHPRELDFYLVSHAAIKGTARPTRYYCIHNDGSLPHDEVEQLTYYLCHLYSRCSRSVSYPTPTYYAHLACLRARALTLGDKFNNADLERKPRRLRVKDAVQQTNPMFFV